MPFYQRKSPRLPKFDYRSTQYYFLTLCTHNKECIFGQLPEMNRLAGIVQAHIEQLGIIRNGVQVDKYVIMPNHVHMIISLQDNSISISYLLALFKTGVTKQIRQIYPHMKVWQRSFHDHVIRNEADYQRIWSYIDTNPIRWEMDCFYKEHRAD